MEYSAFFVPFSALICPKESLLISHSVRGQGYDGASNMASDSVGVQARIKQAAPLATYCMYTVMVVLLI